MNNFVELLAHATDVYGVHALMTIENTQNIVMIQLPPEDFATGSTKLEADPMVDDRLILLVAGMHSTISGLMEGTGEHKVQELQREVQEELEHLPSQLVESVAMNVGDSLSWPLSQTLQVRKSSPILIRGATLPLRMSNSLVEELEMELKKQCRGLVVGRAEVLLKTVLLRPFAQTLLRMYLENTK